jgi:hypothetical protein
MHVAGLGWKRRKGVRATAEPHSDALRFAEVTKQQAALLTGVSQPVTLSARKHFARKVQHRDPPWQARMTVIGRYGVKTIATSTRTATDTCSTSP